MPYPFDATLKEVVVTFARDYQDRFRLPAGPPSSLNVDLSTLSAATDVALGFGKPLREIVDLNFQSGSDAGLPQRGLLYNAALGHHYSIPVRSIFFLLRPEADHRSLTGLLTYNSPPYRVEFQYEVFRLWQTPAESFLEGGLRLLPLAVLGELPDDKPIEETLRLYAKRIEERLLREAPHTEAALLMTAAFVLTGLRVPRKSLAKLYQGIGLMRESSAYEMILEEGEVIGKQAMLLRIGGSRLGVPTRKTTNAIRSIKDCDRLDRLAEAVLTAKNWNALLATE